MQENNFDFNSCLFKDEKILYQGRPTPGKGSKHVGGLLFLICFSLACLGLLIWSLVTKTGDGAYGISLTYTIFFIVLSAFLLLGIYGLVYILFFKKRMVSDDFYCLTNMRAIKYESRKKKLVFGYLAYYSDIHCSNIKNNHGDLFMSVNLANGNFTDGKEPTLLELKDIMLHPNPENMPSICFESIENPEGVYQVAIKARDDVMREINSKIIERSKVSEN